MDGYTILGALLIFFGIFIYITWLGFSIKVDSDKANKSVIVSFDSSQKDFVLKWKIEDLKEKPTESFWADFMKDKLEDILSPQAKEYLKLEKEMKKDFALRRKLRHQRGDVNWSKNKTGFFWSLYMGVLFSGVAVGCYVFDK